MAEPIEARELGPSGEASFVSLTAGLEQTCWVKDCPPGLVRLSTGELLLILGEREMRLSRDVQIAGKRLAGAAAFAQMCWGDKFCEPALVLRVLGEELMDLSDPKPEMRDGAILFGRMIFGENRLFDGEESDQRDGENCFICRSPFENDDFLLAGEAPGRGLIAVKVVGIRFDVCHVRQWDGGVSGPRAPLCPVCRALAMEDALRKVQLVMAKAYLRTAARDAGAGPPSEEDSELAWWRRGWLALKAAAVACEVEEADGLT